MRVVIGSVVAGSLLAGCGSDTPLADLGHMTERWIAAAPASAVTTTIPPVVTAPVGLLATSGSKPIEWVNDDISDLSPTAAAEDAIVAVWSRSNREDRFVQASRSEIVAALPAIQFPELIPMKVAFITSQLVFNPETGDLASDSVAAFGFWSDMPYTKSRTVSQIAVLTVAVDQPAPEPVVVDTIGVPEDQPGDLRCDELVASTVEECKAVTLEDGRAAWSLDATDGWRLVWSEYGYTYDLFVRNAADVDLLAGMAVSCKELVPVVSVLATGDEPEGAPVAIDSEPSADAAGS
jgi:hypothetical protein